MHLTFTLNLMSTYVSDFYNRNEFIKRHLEEFSESFPRKDEVFEIMEFGASKFLRLKLKKKSYWYNKANAFSLLCFFFKNSQQLQNVDERSIKDKLEQFESQLPDDYRLAAKEAVNSKQERLLRNRYLTEVVLG